MALVVVCALSGAALAKPSIAILGLEVIDKTGAPSAEDVTFAKNLTEGLRGRAKIGGPYNLAPNGEKELIDLKLLKSCDDEKPACMSSIGKDLQADFLIYGQVTRKGKTYDVSIALLDVNAGKRERTVPQSTPVGTNGVALQNLSKKIYNGLTGQSDSCTIAVKTPGVDRGTILINGKEAGNITNGVGAVNGLSEGKYSIAIEASGFHRYTKGDVTCTGGETTNLQPDLSRNTPVDTKVPDHSNDTVTSPGLTGTQPHENHETEGTVSHSNSNAVWKGVLVGSAVVTAGMAVGFGIEWSKLATTGKKDDGIFSYGKVCAGTSDAPTAGPDATGDAIQNCPNANSLRTYSYVTGIGTVAFAGLTAFALYKVLHHADDDTSSTEHAGRSSRKHHDPIAITPVVSPNGGGATFRMEW
ncbi:MAG: hypothetical protein QM831_12275 [Kofleriaceae bacterium]